MEKTDNVRKSEIRLKRLKLTKQKPCHSNIKAINGRITAVLCASALAFCLCACGESGQGNAVSSDALSSDTESAEENAANQSVKLSKEHASEALEKEETVSVKADVFGHPQKTTVETTLLVPETGDVIIDETNLQSIKNTDGDEEYELAQDGILLWENQGATISYEGISTEELPVSVKVSYYLDGSKISPSELAGKSGHVTIRFDYENRTSETVVVDDEEKEVPVPFLMLSMAVLPKEHFSNVEVTKGKLITIADETIAVGYALPGVADALKLGNYEPTEDMEIPDFVEITADATDFELEFTETIASTGLFSDLDSEELEDVDDLVDSMDKFKEGSGKLVDGAGKMLDGSNSFQDYLKQYTEGADVLSDHMGTLAAGLDTLDEKTGDLVDGSKAVADGIALLESEITNMESELAAMIEQQTQAAQELAQSAEAVKSAAAEVNHAIDEVDSAAGKINAKTEEINRKVDEVNRAAEEVNSSKGDEEEKIEYVSPMESFSIEQISALENDKNEMASADMDQIDAYKAQIAALKAALAQLKEGSAAVNAGITAYGGGVHQATVGADALARGTKTLSGSGAALNEGYAAMVDGLGKLNDGIIEFDKEGVQKISKLAGKDLENVITGMKALKASDLGYTNFGGIRDGVKGSVRFMIETEEIKAVR